MCVVSFPPLLMSSPVLSPNSVSTRFAALFEHHPQLHVDLGRAELAERILERREALEMTTGALATWNPHGETGRIPKDTYIVKHDTSADTIDWTSPTCIPMEPGVFDSLFADALAVLQNKEELFACRKVIGADSTYALPTAVVSDKALPMMFADNMFRDVPADIEQSVFADQEFTMLVVPHDKIDTTKYEAHVRQAGGKTVDMLIAMDFERKLGLVYGLSYLGGIKKLMFTVMNYLLPEQGILPLHCSANEDASGKTALFLGLSGTGKTTLSNHPGTTLIGDDEHGWSSAGIANFENGCYAKLINLNPVKEPDIYKAAFTKRPATESGVIVENALVYPNGTFDLDDARHAENSRTSYPLHFLDNCKESAMGTHPSTIVFLTADAKGVLPPVAKLHTPQAMLWFLMGYTSKLAGTEVGVTEPVASFSRFFGGPFMPRPPMDYLNLLERMMKEHSVNVYLVNTGWTGGPYGIGERMDITVSRAVVGAALSGALETTEYQEDTRFHIHVPTSCKGVDAKLLTPQSTWDDQHAFTQAADALAHEFSNYFDSAYGNAGLPEDVIAVCPGK